MLSFRRTARECLIKKDFKYLYNIVFELQLSKGSEMETNIDKIQ